MSDGRVSRGGSWYCDDAASLAARARFRYAPSKRNLGLGFRCTQTKSADLGQAYRGGGWYYGAVDSFSAHRGDGDPGIHGYKIVLRAVRRSHG